MFRKKHDPIVNAILRGVYFKDEPVDLTSGKYENRQILLKVPRLTKERILKVSLEDYVKEGLDELRAFNEGITISTYRSGTVQVRWLFHDVGIPWNAVDLVLEVKQTNILFQVLVEIGGGSETVFYTETFNSTGTFKRRIILFGMKSFTATLRGYNAGIVCYYNLVGSHLPFETEVTS